jgi:hypothetical protein
MRMVCGLAGSRRLLHPGIRKIHSADRPGAPADRHDRMCDFGSRSQPEEQAHQRRLEKKQYQASTPVRAERSGVVGPINLN